MKHLKLLLLFFLHLACTLLVQILLFRHLLGEGSGFWTSICCLSFSLAACLADLIFSCLLLKGTTFRRTFFILLQFWDLLLICPLLVMAFLSFLSEVGLRFGLITLISDLLLIIERSASFVFFDPQRVQSE